MQREFEGPDMPLAARTPARHYPNPRRCSHPVTPLPSKKVALRAREGGKEEESGREGDIPASLRTPPTNPATARQPPARIATDRYFYVPPRGRPAGPTGRCSRGSRSSCRASMAACCPSPPGSRPAAADRASFRPSAPAAAPNAARPRRGNPHTAPRRPPSSAVPLPPASSAPKMRGARPKGAGADLGHVGELADGLLEAEDEVVGPALLRPPAGEAWPGDRGGGQGSGAGARGTARTATGGAPAPEEPSRCR